MLNLLSDRISDQIVAVLFQSAPLYASSLELRGDSTTAIREALTKLAEAIWRDDIAQPVYFEHVMAWRDREYPAVPSDAPLSEKP